MKETSGQSSLIPDGYLWPHKHNTAPSTVRDLWAWGDPQKHKRWDALGLFLSQCIPQGKVKSLLPMAQIAYTFSNCSSLQVKSGLPPPLCAFLSQQQGCNAHTDTRHITASCICTISDPETAGPGCALHAHSASSNVTPSISAPQTGLALFHLPRQR